MEVIRKGNSEACKIRYKDTQDAKLAYITFDSLENTGLVKHCFSTRLGGVSKGIFSTMNLSFVRGDDKEAVLENYKRIAEVLECKTSDIVCSQQTHTTNIKRVTKEDCGNGVIVDNCFKDVDGLITNEAGVVLGTSYADCVPLYIVDIENKAIGLSHSGWRGTVEQMGRVTLEAMAKEFGSEPENVKVVIGPSICQSCYEVSADVAYEFQNRFTRDDERAKRFLLRYYNKNDITVKMQEECLMYRKPDGKYQLNLWYANYRVFTDAGVRDENIEITDICTCCNPDFLFSHRASMGKRGNLGAFLALK